MALPTPRSAGTWVMSGRLRVARIRGVAVCLHWTWLPVVLLWGAYHARFYSSYPWAVGEIVAVFIMVLAHECGHVIAARWSGVRASEIILWPLGGLAVARQRGTWRSEMLFAAAGPAVNVLLVPVLFGLWHRVGYPRGGDVSLLLWRIALANLALAGFNILPIWPLDGGRLAQSLLRWRLGLTRSQCVIAIVSLVVGSVGMWWFMRTHAYAAVGAITVLVCLNVFALNTALQMAAAEREYGFDAVIRCPRCHHPALDGPTGLCEGCHGMRNAAANNGQCYSCGDAKIECRYCGEASESREWAGGPTRKPTEGGQRTLTCE